MCSRCKGAVRASGDARSIKAEQYKFWMWTAKPLRNSSSSLIEVLGVKLERGGLHAKKIGGDDAFGFYERTPSLPHTIKEDPRLELHPHFDEAITGSSFTPRAPPVNPAGPRRAPTCRSRAARWPLAAGSRRRPNRARRPGLRGGHRVRQRRTASSSRQNESDRIFPAVVR